MQKTVKVGGDIDAWCTRCKLVLGHTTLALVGTRPARVRCNTCQGEHNFKAAAAEPKKGSWEPKVDRERRLAKPVVTSWEALLARKDVSRARRYSVKELAVFGSAARGEMRPDSDIDLLVEFQPGVKIGLLKHIAAQRELSELLGRKVDLVSKQALRSEMRDEILAEARNIYAA